MRRALAIFLMVGFSLPLIAPLFVSAAAASSLPACCRRDGKHHCMMDQGPSRTRSVTEKCPWVPFAGTALMTPHAMAAAHNAFASAGLTGPAAMVGDALAGYRISADRTRCKRGPPSLL
jgi:hypothetical protein